MSSDVPGPQGERGKTGDIGPTGPTGHLGRAGVAGESGPRGLPGLTAPAAPRRSALGSTLRAAAGLCFAVALLMAMIFSHQELGELRDYREVQQTANDCLALFDADVERAQAGYLSEFGDLFSTAVQLDPKLPEAQRRAVVRRAVADLEARNVPYRNALMARGRYVANDPPPHVCPHAMAED